MSTKIGALWLKDGKKGKFMSGQIELDGKKISVLVFKNNKTKPTHPDYQIVLAEDRGQRPQQYQSGPEPFEDDSEVPF